MSECPIAIRPYTPPAAAPVTSTWRARLTPGAYWCLRVGEEGQSRGETDVADGRELVGEHLTGTSAGEMARAEAGEIRGRAPAEPVGDHPLLGGEDVGGRNLRHLCPLHESREERGVRAGAIAGNGGVVFGGQPGD